MLTYVCVYCTFCYAAKKKTALCRRVEIPDLLTYLHTYICCAMIHTVDTILDIHT